MKERTEKTVTWTEKRIREEEKNHYLSLIK